MSGAATSAANRGLHRRHPGCLTLPGRLVHHAIGVVEAAAGRRQPPPGYTPLVIVGPSGAGKSALVTRMFVQHGGARRAADPPHRHDSGGDAALWDGRTLGHELALALSHDTLHRLRTRFATPRLVIIDAVEQITAWDVQRALAQLIDMAIDGGTSFVVTMRAHPMAARSLEPALASRLAGGLVVPMPPAGALRGREPGGREPAGDGRPPTLRRIINASARLHGLTAADLTGPSRRRRVAHARGVAMYLARTLTSSSLQAIGRACGGRDHTTVLHGIRVTEERRARDPAVAAEIDRLVEALLRL